MFKKKKDQDYVFVIFMRKQLWENQFSFPGAIDEIVIHVKVVVMILPDLKICAETFGINLKKDIIH